MRAEPETVGQVKKVSIFDIIQAQLLQKIEQALDTGERFTWIKPWTHAPYACSYHTPNRPFSAAVNYFFLEPGEYLSYRSICQMQKERPEVHIRKGARQAYVYQNIPVFKKDEQGKEVLDEHGQPVIETFRVRYTREFHIADVKGLQSHFKIPEFSHDATKISRLADALIADYSQKYGIEIVTREGGDKAYSQGKTVVLPAKEQFSSQYQYYSTVFHELAHSTGHFIAERTGLAYAKEELVAEISASFLCAATRLQDDRSMENNVAYLQGWYSRIRAGKPADLYFAANQAKKAANLILDASPRIKEKLRPQIEEPEERSIKACRETTREPSTTR